MGWDEFLMAGFLLLVGFGIGWLVRGQARRGRQLTPSQPDSIHHEVAIAQQVVRQLVLAQQVDHQSAERILAALSMTGPVAELPSSPVDGPSAATVDSAGTVPISLGETAFTSGQKASLRPATVTTTGLPGPVGEASVGWPPVAAVAPEIILAEVVEEVTPLGESGDKRESGTVVHPLDRPETAGSAQVTAQQRRQRALADILQAFMEENNIRWGEVVSGLLIVGCSIAMVISLRRELENLSERFVYLPSLLFMLATAAIHGAGNYTLRRWNLRSTSRGVLIIATLLIPINFLAAIHLSSSGSHQVSLSDPLYWVSLTIGLLAFGTMAYYASQALLPRLKWSLWIGILGPSVGQLLINRAPVTMLADASTCWLITLPLVSFLLANFRAGYELTRRSGLQARVAGEALLMLGMTSFALATALGLLLSSTDSARDTLAILSSPLSLPAVVVLVTGVILARQAARRTAQQPLETPAVGFRTASQRTASKRDTAIAKSYIWFQVLGMALALCGSFLLLVMVVLAWPSPTLVIAVSTTSFVTLTLAAIIGRMPILHAPAVGLASLAILIGVHAFMAFFSAQELVLAGNFRRLFLQGSSGMIFLINSLAAFTIAWFFQRKVARQASLAYGAGGIGLLSLSILVALVIGFIKTDAADASLAAPLLAIQGAMILFIANQLAVQPGSRKTSTLAVQIPVALSQSESATSPNSSLTESLPSTSPSSAPTPATSHLAETSTTATQPETESQELTWNQPLTWQHAIAYLGSTLWLLALLQLWQFNAVFADWCHAWGQVARQPIILSFLIHGLIVSALSWLLSYRWGSRERLRLTQPWRAFIMPLSNASLLSAALAIPFAVFVADEQFGEHAIYVASIGVIWLLASLLQATPVAFAIFQLFASLAVSYFTTALCQRHPAWDGRWAIPWHIQAQTIALALSCLGWKALRIGWPPRLATLRLELGSKRFMLDQILLVGLTITFFVWLVMAALLGAAMELNWVETLPAQVEIEWRNVVDSAGAWFALGSLLSPALLACWDSVSRVRTWSLLLLTFLLAVLAAGPWWNELAIASALRWTVASYGLLLTASVAWLQQQTRTDPDHSRQPPFSQNLLRRLHIVDCEALKQDVRTWSLATTGLIVVGLTTVRLWQAIERIPLRGPSENSWFTLIGPECSYGIPLIALIGMLIGYAALERRSIWFATGAVVSQYLVNLAFLLAVMKTNPLTWDTSLTIQLWQVNLCGLALYELVWLGMLQRWAWQGDRRVIPVSNDRWFTSFFLLLLCFLILISVFATWSVIFNRDFLDTVAELSRWPTFLALVLGSVVATWWIQAKLEPWGLSLLFGFMIAGGGPLALWVDLRLPSWTGLAVLFMIWSLTATLATIGTWSFHRWQQHQAVMISFRWGTIWLSLTALLAVLTVEETPPVPWFCFGMTGWAALLATALGLRNKRLGYAYGSAIIAMLAALLLVKPLLYTGFMPQIIGRMQLLSLGALVIAPIWLGVELRSWYRWGDGFVPPANALTLPVFVTRTLCVLWSLVVPFCYWLTSCLNVDRDQIELGSYLAVMMMVLFGGLLIGLIWDRRARGTSFTLFIYGLILLLMILDSWDQVANWSNQQMVLTTQLAVAGWIGLSGHLWRYGADLTLVARRLGVPAPVRLLRETARWMPPATLLLTVILMLVGVGIVCLHEARWMRVSAAFSLLLPAYGIGCQAQQQRRGWLPFVSLWLVSWSAILATWAELQPDWSDQQILERALRMMMVFASLTLIGAIPLTRWVRNHGSTWFDVIQRWARQQSAAAILSLLLVLVLEWCYFVPGEGVPFLQAYQGIVVGLIFVGLIIALLTFALSAQRDPLRLSEERRQLYVYAAQGVAVLLLAHFYLVDPSLFRLQQPSWAFVMVGIAFGSVGVGELCQRLKLPVLAKPLQRTGGFLPLLPALGWWLSGAAGEATAGQYALLLFAIGLLYLWLSMIWQSWLSGTAAVLAGNVALWSLLADYEPLSLFKHPQFWLIPPAVSLLAAAQVLRQQLGEQRLTALRYLCLIVIYVSSTGDIFLDGLGRTFWEPMVLATLSVLGMLIGIALRIRAFLYMGVTFVLLAVFSMIWHAYTRIQHVAIWWAFGIVLGLTILTLFGIFEKKRSELQAWITRLKSWEQ